MKVNPTSVITTGDNTDPGKGARIGVRLQPGLLKALDKRNADDLSRPEAIRRLVEFALIPKPGSLSVSSERVAAINDCVNKHEPGLPLPEAISRLVEIGLKVKGK